MPDIIHFGGEMKGSRCCYGAGIEADISKINIVMQDVNRVGTVVVIDI